MIVKKGKVYIDGDGNRVLIDHVFHYSTNTATGIILDSGLAGMERARKYSLTGILKGYEQNHEWNNLIGLSENQSREIEI